jgi:hypothetical protein
VTTSEVQAQDRFLTVKHLEFLNGHYIIALEPSQIILCEVVFSLNDQTVKIQKVKEINFSMNIRERF